MNDFDGFITSLGAFTITLHEMFEGFIEAGFTRDEAMHLTTVYMTEVIRLGGDFYEK